MEMEVVVAVPPPPPSLPSMDFNFDSNCSSPYITAPSSPQPFGNLFFSAPTSPTRSFFRHSTASSSSVLEPIEYSNEDDFEFNFSSHLQRPSLSAEELFHGGKIRPLKLPPSPTKPNKTEQNRVVQEEEGKQKNKQRRERASSFSIPSSSHKGSGRRSLSRVSESNSFSESESNGGFTQRSNNKGVSSRSNSETETESETTSTFSSFLSSISFSKGYRKWRIKDFLLFRSASEGRATDKDPLRKYAVLSKTTAHEDVVVNSSSFRSTESSSGSVSRRRGPVSAHELHYTLNRAASEELKKKTMLPYKQGLLGCLGFNHGMQHQISGRFGSLERS